MSVAKVYCAAMLALAMHCARSAPPVEVPAEPHDQVIVEAHPLTSVVITQCNLIVAVYVTMPDGRLLRFDKSTAIKADQLMQMAYSADRSQRIEMACEADGVVGYEKRDPV